MKRAISLFFVSILLIGILCPAALAQELLIPGGQVIGLELVDSQVTLAAFDESGPCPARQAGLEVGDALVALDGRPITCPQDVQTALEHAAGEIALTFRRGSRERTVLIDPRTEQGPRLGVYLRQGITGIGTVTYYDPEDGSFGSLGHGVSNPSGGLQAMDRGSAYAASVGSVRRGKAGTPGQLRGSAQGMQSIGTLRKNTPQGVFGTARPGFAGEPLPVAEFDQVTTGPATIRSTISGNTPQEYSVEIVKIYSQDRSDHRNFLLRVTDPRLLAATGGIVQGMSGSPIIQNGRIVGAVTHVLVNDPTTGYGIFIDNMLDAAA